MPIDRLYQVASTMDNWPHRGWHYNSVRVHWFRADHRFDIDDDATFTPLITGDAGDFYARAFINELFTKDEADLLVHYLQEQHATACDITEVSLPIASHIMPWGGIPIGGPFGNYDLFEEAPYTLPFRVRGQYDVEDMTPIEEAMQRGHAALIERRRIWFPEETQPEESSAREARIPSAEDMANLSARAVQIHLGEFIARARALGRDVPEFLEQSLHFLDTYLSKDDRDDERSPEPDQDPVF
jgi:hypothetical protein